MAGTGRLLLAVAATQLIGWLHSAVLCAADGQTALPPTTKRTQRVAVNADGPGLYLPGVREMVVSVGAQQFAILGKGRLGMIVGAALTKKNERMHDVGYYLTMPVPNGRETRPDYDLYGPIWDMQDRFNTPIEGKVVYEIKLALCHPMLSIGNSTWGWFTNGEHRIPWFYSPLYYVVKDQCGLVRYELKKGPSDHRLTRCVFVAANRRWAAAGIMDPGNGMGSVVNVAPGRFALQAEYDRVRNLPVTNSVLIYDTVEDRFVDDPWLRNLLQGLRGYRWVTGSVSITADRNWLLVFPVTAYDTDDARDVPPAKINYDGTELLREKQFLVFHRGDKKPQVVDVDRKCQPSEPQDAFVDGKGDLQLVYGVSGTVIVPLKGGNRHSCGFRFRGYRTFDTSRSVLTGFADRSLGGFVGDGAKLSCIIEVARWPYLSSNCETATVRFDDLFEVRGRTIVPGKKQAIPIGE